LTQEASVFNTETFRGFLSCLVNSIGKPILLILDRASYHRAKDLKPFLQEHQSRLTLAFLPPYSPELNPIERVWRITRRKVTHNRYFPEIGGLREDLINQFAQWSHPNEALKVLCANI
jgi:transposase